jgi:hypothetical protein
MKELITGKDFLAVPSHGRRAKREQKGERETGKEGDTHMGAKQLLL